MRSSSNTFPSLLRSWQYRTNGHCQIEYYQQLSYDISSQLDERLAIHLHDALDHQLDYSLMGALGLPDS